MRIYVQHNGEEGGPYSLDEVRTSLRASAFSRDDHAWHEGLDAWKPLGDVLLDLHRSSTDNGTALAVEPQNAASPSATSPANLRTSRRGILIAGGVLALITLSIAGWGFFASREQGRTSQESPSPAQSSEYDAHPTDTPAQNPPTLQAAAKPAPFDLVALAKQTRGAVVLIETFDASNQKIATGSGFFISSDGLLITNYHVIKGAESAVAKVANGGLFPIVGARAVDRDNDLVLLATEGKNLPFLNLRDTAGVEPGTRIAVMGNPRGLEGSLSEGIVSAKRGGAAEHRWLQITAAISPGSSGSPVMDESGRVLGIATMVITNGQSLNFAVPGEIANALWNTAIRESELTSLSTLKLIAAASDWKRNPSGSPEERAAIDAHAKAKNSSQLHKDWETALRCDKALIAKFPDHDMGYWFTGEAYSAMGFSDDAIAAFQQAVKLNPSNLYAWHDLAKLYKEKGKTTQADYAFSQCISLYQKIAESPPSVPFSDGKFGAASRERKACDFLLLAEVCHDAGRVEDAVRAYQSAENIGGMGYNQWSQIGHFYWVIDRPDDAMRAYKSEAKVNNGLSDGFPFLAGLYANRGQIEKAAEALHNWQPAWKDSEVWRRVSQLVEEKHPELVEKCFETYRRLEAQGK